MAVSDHPDSTATVTWAPEACRLPTAERPLRVEEFGALFADALRRVDRETDTRLRLTLRRRPGTTGRVEDLVSRETECCSFFEFRVRSLEDAIVLDVAVPRGQVEVLDGLERQARATMHAR